jgi:hypothetical protein
MIIGRKENALYLEKFPWNFLGSIDRKYWIHNMMNSLRLGLSKCAAVP